MTVTVTGPANSTISPSAITYNILSPSDVQVNMGLNGNTLSNIKNGASNLVVGTDYTVVGNVVTIKKGYFTYYFSKFHQSLLLNFVFSSGSTTLTVVPVYPDSSVSPSSA